MFVRMDISPAHTCQSACLCVRGWGEDCPCVMRMLTCSVCVQSLFQVQCVTCCVHRISHEAAPVHQTDSCCSTRAHVHGPGSITPPPPRHLCSSLSSSLSDHVAGPEPNHVAVPACTPPSTPASAASSRLLVLASSASTRSSTCAAYAWTRSSCVHVWRGCIYEDTHSDVAVVCASREGYGAHAHTSHGPHAPGTRVRDTPSHSRAAGGGGRAARPHTLRGERGVGRRCQGVLLRTYVGQAAACVTEWMDRMAGNERMHTARIHDVSAPHTNTHIHTGCIAHRPKGHGSFLAAHALNGQASSNRGDGVDSTKR